MAEKAKYEFVGQGQGIPGLPHQITAEKAALYEREHKEAEKRFRDDIRANLKESGKDWGEAEDIDLANALVLYPWTQLQAALENGNYQEVKGASQAEASKKKDGE